MQTYSDFVTEQFSFSIGVWSGEIYGTVSWLKHRHKCPEFRVENSCRKYTISEVITAILLTRDGRYIWSFYSRHSLAWERMPSGRSQTGLYFFLAEVLEYVVEFPLNLLCSIIFFRCCFFCLLTYSLYGVFPKGCSQFPKSCLHMDQYSQTAMPHSPQYWVPPPQSLPEQLLLTVKEKRSGDFRQSAGSGLRKRKVCMIGQASMKQTLRWRLGCRIFMGEWGKQDWAATTEASDNPTVGLWSWTGLAELSPARAKGPGFYTVVCRWLTRLPQGIGVWPCLRQLSLV